MKRRWDKHGQPQWRRKVIIVGLPFGSGNCSLEDEGALAPISSVAAVRRAGGLFHELSSCWNVMA